MGLLILSSATLNVNTDQWFFVKKQILWIIIGSFFFICGPIIRLWGIVSLHHAIFTPLILYWLLAVLLVGSTAKGAQLWLSLGPLGGQPSELGQQ